MSVHERVLTAANKIAALRKDWSFRLDEVLRELPELNESTVRTHVVSRCCVNAPKNHIHRWPYFRRIGRGLYQVEPACRSKPLPLQKAAAASAKSPLRETLHAIIQKDTNTFTVECM